jgi:simple sugar transport system ATP-binding protein
MELRQVSKRFAGIDALRDVSIAVHAGSVLCLLGDNGAGMSTVIMVVWGFHPPSTGAIIVDGA